MNTTLFRPIGLHELSLIWDSKMRQFPPRLPQQPIFYPVANIDYARQIARDWNMHDEKSGFSGFVTAFEVESNYLSNFELHTVGASMHREYWVPADDLNSFNAAISGPIRLEEAFFGAAFTGYIPNRFGLKGRDAVAQFVALWTTWDYNRMDFSCEIAANPKPIFINWLFWEQHDFSGVGLSHEQQKILLGNLRLCWEQKHFDVPLPGKRNS